MKNNLPKSFGVLNNGSIEFERVIHKLHENYKPTKPLSKKRGEGFFYGIAKDGELWIGLRPDFDKILSIEEFIELSKEAKTLKDSTILDCDNFPEQMKGADVIRDANNHSDTFIRKDLFATSVKEFLSEVKEDTLLEILLLHKDRKMIKSVCDKILNL